MPDVRHASGWRSFRTLSLMLCLAVALIAIPAVALAAGDTTPPSSASDAAASYLTPPAVIVLTASDGGYGVATLSYRVDGGATVTVRASAPAGVPVLGIPPAHAGGSAPFNCACHSGIVYAGHGGGPAPADCTPCHAVAHAVSLSVPASHAARLTGCKGCHPSVAPVIMPTTPRNPTHYGQTPGFPGGGACESCHTFPVVFSATSAGLTATVTVSGYGPHSLEFWAEDFAGNVETHHVASFGIVGDPFTILTIKRSAASVRLRVPFILSGVLLPSALGDPVAVYVKKPGSPRWSYSSIRLVYSIQGSSGSWWYRYTPLMRGTYSFYASFVADTVPMAQSPRVSVSVR
jgi:hypothetical protein